MKKLKKITALLLTAALLLGLTACGGPTYDESLLGVYTCYAVEMMGYNMPADEVLSEASTLELKQGGKGNMNVEGESGSIKYTLDGENITVEIEGETAKGTLKEGVIDIEIMEMHMFFIQEGKEIPVTTPPEVGYYDFFSAEIDGESFTAEDLAALGTDAGYASLQLNEDGTGSLVMDGEAQDFTWADGKLTADGESMDYTMDGDKITISTVGYEMTFVRGETPAETPAEPAEADPAVETPVEAGGSDAAGAVLPISLDVDEYHFEIVGAEQYTDLDGETAVRLYIDYTNNSDDYISFYTAVYCEAFQDGYQLMEAYPDYDMPEVNSASKYVLPGCSVRVVQEYIFKPDGGQLEFKLYKSSVDDAVVVTMDPASLPGAPTEPFVYSTSDSSALVAGLSDSGSLNGVYDVAIRDVEMTENWEGDPLVRVFMDFTNNSEETTTLWDQTLITVMQDGVQLDSDFANERIDSDDHYSTDVEPGETITISVCYMAHDTGSPVAFLLEGFMFTDEIGAVLELP